MTTPLPHTDAYIAHRLAVLGLVPDQATLERIIEVTADLEQVAALLKRPLPFDLEPLFGAVLNQPGETR